MTLRIVQKGNAVVIRNQTSRGGDAVSHDPDFFEIRRPDQIDRLIALHAALGHTHRIDLLREARAGVINLVEFGRQAAAPMKALERSRRPVIVLLGDDDYASTGPTGWVAWRRLGYWASGALVHGTGADTASYRLALGLAVMHRRFLLIETDSAHAHEWGAALQKRNIPAIGLLPPGDGVHPVAPAQEAMQ